MNERMGIEMKEKIVVAIMVLICAAIFIGSQLKNDRPSTPEDTILGLIQAAEKSHTQAYLGFFCDEFRVNLEEQINRMGEEVFRRLSQENYKNLAGIAIGDRMEEGDQMLRLTVEFVYEGYDDMKSFLLKKINGEWKIKGILDDARSM